MIEITKLTKTFSAASGDVAALRDISITIETGEIFGIIGMSGAGKSTLVRCINMLERPESGSVVIDGVDIGALNDRELRQMRRSIAMIFQGFNLLLQRNCLQNVCFPMLLAGAGKKAAEKRARELLALVGLEDKAASYPSQLSGGQKQRVAIARALATEPKVLLCDEATSALDPKTTSSVLELLREINKKLGITIVIITHQMSIVEEVCSRVAILDGGRLAESGRVSDVFASPRSDAAKRLVYPQELAVSARGERYIRVVFRGERATNTPLIATLAQDKGIRANILSANTRNIEGRVYGNMLLGISGGDRELCATIDFLRSENDIFAEEIELGDSGAQCDAPGNSLLNTPGEEE